MNVFCIIYYGFHCSLGTGYQATKSILSAAESGHRDAANFRIKTSETVGKAVALLMDDSVSVLTGPLGTVNHRSGLSRRGGGNDEMNRYTRAVWWSG